MSARKVELGRVRVVGGNARGRTLRSPRSREIRPTSDRVREAIFDVLGHLNGANVVEDASVLDLFAGSGGLGIEALSRGADSVIFVDSAKEATEMIEANLSAIGLGSSVARVVRAEVLSYLSGHPAGVELALVDPPYAFDNWTALLGVLDAEIVVLESNREIQLVPPWKLYRSYRYGTTVVTVARRSPAERSGSEETQ